MLVRIQSKAVLDSFENLVLIINILFSKLEKTNLLMFKRNFYLYFKIIF